MCPGARVRALHTASSLGLILPFLKITSIMYLLTSMFFYISILLLSGSVIGIDYFNALRPILGKLGKKIEPQ